MPSQRRLLRWVSRILGCSLRRAHGLLLLSPRRGPMPNCPKCGRPMATVLKREGGKVQTYHECRVCLAEEKKAKQSDKKAEEAKRCPTRTPSPSLEARSPK